MPFPFIPALLVAGGVAVAAKLGLRRRKSKAELAARAKALSHGTRLVLVEAHKGLAAARRDAAASLESLGRARRAFWAGPMRDFARGFGETVASWARDPAKAPVDPAGPSEPPEPAAGPGEAKGSGAQGARGTGGAAQEPEGQEGQKGQKGSEGQEGSKEDEAPNEQRDPGRGACKSPAGPFAEALAACRYTLLFESEVAAPASETGGMRPAAFVQLGALGPRLASDIVWFSRQERVFKGYFNPTVDWIAGILPEKAFEDEPGSGPREDREESEERLERVEREANAEEGEKAANLPERKKDAILGGELPPWLALTAKSILRSARAEQGTSGGLFGRGRAEEAAERMENGALACRAVAAHAFRVQNALAPFAEGLARSLSAVRELAMAPLGAGGPSREALSALREGCLYAVAAYSLLRAPLLRADGGVDDRSVAALREAEISSLARPDAGGGSVL
ncbi:MAG: hypothetical protein LBQ12_06035 [Deltaproteobacteria bacterium]|jgi:hypothetical protein|nr:hypothetical protein [Deltaproteobacteria bacterium]